MVGDLEREPCQHEDCEVRRIAAEVQKEMIERRRIEERLADAQRIAHIGHWNWDILTNELSWSDEIYRIFGLQPQEFGATYDAFLERVHEEDRVFVMEAVNRAVFQHAAYSIDHRIIRPSGEVRIVHEQAEVSFDDRGKAARMLGTVQDVTESRVLGMELERKEEMLRLVLEALPVGVWIADKTGRITTTNQAAIQIWGTAPHVDFSESKAYKAWDLKSGHRLRAEDWAMARALLTGEPQSGQEARIETFDGKVKIIRIWGAPVVDPNGKLTGAIAVAEDITSQFAAKQALSRAEEELRKLTQHQTRLREREKEAFARELHEGIGQLLSAALLQAASIRKETELSPGVALRCQAMEGILKEAMEAVRRLSSDLRPPLLDHFGLVEALEFLISETRKTRGITCSLSVLGKMPDTDDLRTLGLFRICQEAISRASHLKAAGITVSLREAIREKGPGIFVEVKDNGAALDPESDAASELAILVMRERATEMGGIFEVKTDPEQGTVASVWVPTPLRIP